jgi:hypothetical protein
MGKTDEENIQELMKRVEANDAGAMTALGTYYFHGQLGLLQVGIKQWNYGNRPRNLGIVTLIFNWVPIMMQGEI